MQHGRNLIQTQPPKSSIRPAFDSSMISVTAIMERDIAVHSVLNTDQNNLWVYYEDNTLKLYDEQLEEKKKTKKLSVNSTLQDMVLTASGDIIATDWDHTRLVQISPSGNISTLCSTESLYPSGICLNNRGHIVVGVDAASGKRPIKLSIYSSDGSAVLQEIENGEDGKPLFRRGINQVKQNGRGDYVVADGDRIVCVSSEGRFRWDYNVVIYIRRIVCDKYDNVIIAENLSNKIILLSSEGKLVTTLLTAEDGLCYPRSLSIDRHGQLWIGQATSLKVVKYLE